MREIPLDLSGRMTGDVIYRLVERHGIVAPFRLLDVGTGKGEVVEFFRDEGIEAFGVDLRSVFPVKDYFIVADVRSIPFEKHSFKVVTESLMIAQMYELDHRSEEDVVKVIGEVDRVLESGGVFVSNWGFNNRVRPNWGRRVLNGHMSRLGYEDLNRPTERNIFLFRKH